jgi:hypothetical protein
MTDPELLAALDDRQALALTAWAEARRVPRDDDSHSPVEELIAVMVVCRNRLPHYTRWAAHTATYTAICLAPAQFSCWTAGSGSNHDLLMAQARLLVGGTDLTAIDPELRECLWLADGVIAGELRDRTNAADSYWAPAAMVPPGRTPGWAVGKPKLLIGDQYFITL